MAQQSLSHTYHSVPLAITTKILFCGVILILLTLVTTNPAYAEPQPTNVTANPENAKAANNAGNTTVDGNATVFIDATNETTAPQSIDNQVKQLQTQLNDIQLQLTEQGELANIRDLLSQMVKTAKNLKKQTVNPSKSSLSQHISDAVRLSYNINKANQSHESYVKQIEPTLSNLEDIKQQLLTLQQLLINPVNQSDSQVSHSKVTELIATTSSMQAQLKLVIDQEKQLITKAKQAVVSLESQQNSLLQTLEEKTKDDASASNTEQVKKKIVALEVDLVQMRAELAKDKNQKSLTELQTLQTSILLKQHELWLYNLDYELLQWLQPLTASLPVGQSMLATEDELQTAHDKAQSITDKIDAKIDEVKARQATLNQYAQVIGGQPELKTAYKTRLDNLQFLQLQLQALQARYDERLGEQDRHNLFARKKIFQKNGFSTHLANMPSSLLKMGYQTKISITQFVDNIVKNPWQIFTVLAIMLLIGFLLNRLARFKYGRELLDKNKDISLIILLIKVAMVLKKHAYLTSACLFIAIISNFIELPAPSYHIILLLVSVTFSLMLWFAISRLEQALGVVTNNAAWHSNISMLVLAICVLLYALSSLSAVSPPLVDFYEKLLMLGIAGAAWSSQRYINTLIKQTETKANETKNDLPKSKTYLSYVMFVTVLPIVIIITSLLGVIGFTQLSWMVLRFALVLFLVFTLFTLGVLLINSMRKQLKLASIKRYERGVFFAQDIINPLSLLAKMLWLGCCGTLLLFFVNMWRGDNLIFITEMFQWVFKPLFSINNNAISLFSIIMMVASPFIVYRIGKWLRTFSFHWLFSRVSDYGIRHSLSIFSQYVAILIGVLVTLKIIGLNLTSFAVFAGALGVGVGLGLQDIAKNFISGILLLIERPLRQGDWVMIDGNEGFVKSIGLRAIVLENFDKQEVIIPNGNAVNNSLTNFTHSNKIKRTVIYVGVSYDCEPDKVHRILTEVLESNKAVLNEPGWEIILWEYADSAINYRIHYHIDLNQSERFATKNAILKRIWYVFNEEGISIPYPQRDVYVKNADVLSHQPDHQTKPPKK